MASRPDRPLVRVALRRSDLWCEPAVVPRALADALGIRPPPPHERRARSLDAATDLDEPLPDRDPAAHDPDRADSTSPLLDRESPTSDDAALDGDEVKKIVYVPNRIINVIH